MKITILIENSTKNEQLACEHGLSLLIQINKQNILFDTGASTKFADNAKNLGIDLAKTDIAILSHGHYDHSGGLEYFLNINKTAPVYMHETAFGEYFSKNEDESFKYIGVNKNIQTEKRFRFISALTKISDDLTIFTNTSAKYPPPKGNARLYTLSANNYTPDTFTHEINLMITKGDKRILLAGCAHNGILNIMESSREYFGAYPNIVIGGFHLFKRGGGSAESTENINILGKKLLTTGAMFYTGETACAQLATIMGNNLELLHTGKEIEII